MNLCPFLTPKHSSQDSFWINSKPSKSSITGRKSKRNKKETDVWRRAFSSPYIDHIQMLGPKGITLMFQEEFGGKRASHVVCLRLLQETSQSKKQNNSRRHPCEKVQLKIGRNQVQVCCYTATQKSELHFLILGFASKSKKDSKND